MRTACLLVALLLAGTSLGVLSGWSPDAVFMPHKCGATAAWHNQPDNGTFELFACGRNLMTDSGCYLYGSTSPEEQRFTLKVGPTTREIRLNIPQTTALLEYGN